ncbi:MAG: V-type ATP synthase subunit E [Anaerovoracaceae bacterium]|jgi:V/A-type H+-transporting ATPase subunit E
MSMEQITSKITDDARQKADQILKEANEKADAIKEDALRRSQRIRNAAGRTGAEEKEKIISRKDAVADIDSRKMLLLAKRQLMDQCFDEALESFVEMDKDEYVPFLSGIVQKTGMKSGEIVLNEKDRKAVGEDLLHAVNQDGAKFTLSDQTGDFAAGLKLISGDIILNGTVESYIEEVRESMALEIAEVLFGKE